MGHCMAVKGPRCHTREHVLPVASDFSAACVIGIRVDTLAALLMGHYKAEFQAAWPLAPSWPREFCFFSSVYNLCKVVLHALNDEKLHISTFYSFSKHILKILMAVTDKSFKFNEYKWKNLWYLNVFYHIEWKHTILVYYRYSIFLFVFFIWCMEPKMPKMVIIKVK